MERFVYSDAGLFVAAEGKGDVDGAVAVDGDGAGLNVAGGFVGDIGTLEPGKWGI